MSRRRVALLLATVAVVSAALGFAAAVAEHGWRLPWAPVPAFPPGVCSGGRGCA